MKPCSLPLAILLFALCSQSSIAHGEDVDANRVAARALAFDANAALENQDFAAAAERFARADALVHAPTLLLGLARANVGLGKLSTAHEVYARILREGVARGSPAVFHRTVEDAKSELAELELRMHTVVVEVKGAPALRTKRDLAPAPRAASITSLRAPDAAELGPPSPARASSARKTLGLVAIGVGSAALVTGALTGILALEREGDLSAACPDGHCPPSAQSSVDTYSSLRIAAGSTLLAGAALAFSLGSHAVAMTATGPGGTGNCSTSFAVGSAGTPVCSFAVTPTSGGYGAGGLDTTFTATWMSSGATSCTWSINGVNQGALACNGSTTFLGSQYGKGSYSVSLNMTGPGGTNACTTSLSIVDPPTCSVFVTPTSGFPNDTFKATWSSSADATSADAYVDSTLVLSGTCAGGFCRAARRSPAVTLAPARTRSTSSPRALAARDRAHSASMSAVSAR